MHLNLAHLLREALRVRAGHRGAHDGLLGLLERAHRTRDGEGARGPSGRDEDAARESDARPAECTCRAVPHVGLDAEEKGRVEVKQRSGSTTGLDWTGADRRGLAEVEHSIGSNDWCTCFCARETVARRTEPECNAMDRSMTCRSAAQFWLTFELKSNATRIRNSQSAAHSTFQNNKQYMTVCVCACVCVCALLSKMRRLINEKYSTYNGIYRILHSSVVNNACTLHYHTARDTRIQM